MMSVIKYLCLLLIRESSAKGTIESDGPELQLMRGLVAAEKRFNIPRDQVMIVNETKSGRYEDRPTLDEAFELVKAHQIPILLFNDIDRFTRAGPKHYDQLKVKFKAVGCDIYDVKGIIQPEQNTLEGSGGDFGADFAYDWSVYAASEQAEMAAAQLAKDEARKILGRMIPAEIYGAQQGRTVRPAPFGFSNVKTVDDSGKPQASKKPREDEARYVRRIFEGMAVGRDIRALCDELNADGFLTRRNRKWSADLTKVVGVRGGLPLTPEKVRDMIKRPVYAGFICEKWTHNYPVPANHNGLVSLEMWNAANQGKWKLEECAISPTGWVKRDTRKSKTKRTYLRERSDFPFKALVTCQTCGKPLLAGKSRSQNGERHGYYFCARGHKRISIGQDALHDALKQYLKDLTFTPAMANRFEKHLREMWAVKMRELNQKLMTDCEQIAQLREQADALYESLKLIKEPHLVQRMEVDYSRFFDRIKLLEAKRDEKEYSEADFDRSVKWARYFVEHLDELVLEAQDEGFRAVFWAMIFKQPPTLAEIQNRTARLSPLVRLKDDLESGKSNVVGQDPLRENQIWEEFWRWFRKLQVFHRPFAFTSSNQESALL